MELTHHRLNPHHNLIKRVLYYVGFYREEDGGTWKIAQDLRAGIMSPPTMSTSCLLRLVSVTHCEIEGLCWVLSQNF